MPYSSAYTGEIYMFAGNYAPRNFGLCNGQLLPIAQNTQLFTVIGTTYGGNGTTTFALPDLRGRVPMHFGTGTGVSARVLGQSGGAETVTLTAAQLPAHTHTLNASTAGGDRIGPGGNLLATDPLGNSAFYRSGVAPNSVMASNAIAPFGSGQPHENMPPYVGLTFVICLFGIFPPT
jgi:microcystin-dependent protein